MTQFDFTQHHPGPVSCTRLPCEAITVLQNPSSVSPEAPRPVSFDSFPLIRVLSQTIKPSASWEGSRLKPAALTGSQMPPRGWGGHRFRRRCSQSPCSFLSSSTAFFCQHYDLWDPPWWSSRLESACWCGWCREDPSGHGTTKSG